MPSHPHRLWLVLAFFAASLLASCGGDDEGYPPFEMTYTLGVPGESFGTWRLEYRAADDWTKTLVATEGDGPFEVGRTARWDGDRIEWASAPDRPFVRDGAPEASPVHGLPERWFGNALDDLPNEVWEEIEPPREGTRRFRNEFSVDPVMTEVVTFDVETGLPIAYESHGAPAIDRRFEMVDFVLR